MILTEATEKYADYRQKNSFAIEVRGRPSHPFFAFTIRGRGEEEPLRLYYGKGNGLDSGFLLLRSALVRQSIAALLIHKAERDQGEDGTVGPREIILFRNALIALDNLLIEKQLEEKI